MYFVKTLVGGLMVWAGFTNAETDLRRRQQCIDKCVNNQKPKFMRPMHRFMCKIHCNRRHGDPSDTSDGSFHPAFNGEDGLFRS